MRTSGSTLTLLVTAVTTNTRPQRFFSSAQTCGLVDVNQPLPYGFNALAKRRFMKILSRFSSTRRNMPAFKPFLQYFATGFDTASCQDYEENEFVECLSEEIQIIDLFTHYKL